MAGSSLGNAARLAKVAALLLFLLPWMALSYAPAEIGNALGVPDSASMFGTGATCPVVRASGLQLARGSAEINRDCRGDLADLVPDTSPADDPDSPLARPEIPVVAAVALTVLALIAGLLLKGRAGAGVAAAGAALAAAALCYSVLVRIPQALRDAPAGSRGGPEMTADQLARIIQVEPQVGFWLAIAALLAATAFDLMAMRALSR